MTRDMIWPAYALAAALAATEITILALALSPKVGQDYRAFYIDRTTTCLNRETAGSYLVGQTVSFRRDGGKAASNIKVCGWTGPAGDGTHSLGDTSRLRVKVENPGPLVATIEMSAVLRAPVFRQRVVISVNGDEVDRMILTEPTPRKFTFAVPGRAPTLEISFDYLDGIAPNRSASNIYRRAIKLISFKLAEASQKSELTERIYGQQTPTGPSRQN
jgi:hypothetical protein